MAQFHELCDIAESNHIIQRAFANPGVPGSRLPWNKELNKQASIITITVGWLSSWVVDLAMGHHAC